MSASKGFPALLCLCVAFLSACKPTSVLKLEGHAMGTTWSLVLAKPISFQEAQSLQSLIEREIQTQESHFSNWDPHSEVSRFNAYESTDWFPASPALIEVATTSHQLSEMTGGAFDGTIQPKLQSLGIQPGKASPDAPVNFRVLEIRISPPALRKLHPKLTINFTALVEGYTIDQTVQSIRNQGFEHFLFELGGELFASGFDAQSQPWKVGVQHPNPKIKEPYAELELSNEAISTSGTYRQHFYTENRKISHIVDARTGNPITHKMVSISVKHTKSLWADGLATALMTLKEEEAKSVAKKENLSALFILEKDLHENHNQP